MKLSSHAAVENQGWPEHGLAFRDPVDVFELCFKVTMVLFGVKLNALQSEGVLG